MTEPFSVTIRNVVRRATAEQISEHEHAVRLDGSPDPLQALTLSDASARVLKVEGRIVTLLPLGEGRWYETRTRQLVHVERAQHERAARAAEAGSGSAELRAPMAGRIVRVLVSEGQAVASGDGVIVIEAMKMENELGAPRAGIVARVSVQNGDAVERDAVLIEMKSA